MNHKLGEYITSGPSFSPHLKSDYIFKKEQTFNTFLAV